jgi:hypothetical protein
MSLSPLLVTLFSTKWRPYASESGKHDVLPSFAQPSVSVTLRNEQPNIRSAHMPSSAALDDVIVYL